MKKTMLYLIVSSLLISASLVGVSAYNTTTQYPPSPAQTFDPFTEVIPGVYVYWQWWNESIDNHSEWPNEYNYTYDYYYSVQANNGSWYYIHEFYSGYSLYEWSMTNFLVCVILDPDASFIASLNMNNLSMPYDLWYIYWSPGIGVLSGDEVVIYSAFYYDYYWSSYAYTGNYTWYDEFMNPVNPDLVIPILTEEYQWAAALNASYEYAGEWTYRGFGYDVNELTVHNTRTEWMQHYFSGLSVFNDTNQNGIMDLYYDIVEYDWNNDSITDYTYKVLNTTRSEYLCDFYLNTGTLGSVVEPHLTADNQIEWSVEMVDLSGTFSNGFYTSYMCGPCQYERYPGNIYEFDPIEFDADLDRLQMTYRFGVTNDAAVLKIDQYVGDFTDPITRQPLYWAQGLGLTLNYWSAFSSHEIMAFDDLTWTTWTTGTEPWTTSTEYVTTTIEYPTIETSNSGIPITDGEMQFAHDYKELVSIEFGGTYLWGKNNQIYEVGTLILPDYGCYIFLDAAVPTVGEVNSPNSDWAYGVYYYASCYPYWDGYAITHDPVFIVYPGIAPISISSFITALLTASIVVGVVGLVALSTVCIRMNATRRSN